MKITNKKILITGGAGFIGGHLCEYALENGNDVVIVDSINNETSTPEEKARNLENIKDTAVRYNKKLTFYPCNINDEDQLNKIFMDENPNILIHAASLVKDRWSMDVPLEFIDVNVRGTQVLINSSSNASSLEQILFISSRSAVGEVSSASTIMSEENAFRPINPYGATKAASEGLFYSNHHNTGIPLKICRMQPVYGPRGRNDMFVKRILESTITGKEIQKYGSGEGVRDWLYISDAVSGIYQILHFETSFEIFNIGIGVSTSTNKLIQLCEEITGKKANIVNIEAPPGDAHFAGVADCSKMRKLLGWEAKVNISEGIKKTYDYMLKVSKQVQT